MNGLRACKWSLRRNSNPLPCTAFVPDLVCALTTAAAEVPNSASIVGGRHLGLGHGLEGRIDHDPAEHRVVVIRSVQQVGDPRETLAIYQQAGRNPADSPADAAVRLTGHSETPGVINWKLVNRRFSMGSSATAFGCKWWQRRCARF